MAEPEKAELEPEAIEIWIEVAAARIASEHGIADRESVEAAIAETHLPVADQLLTHGLKIVGENQRLRAQLARWRAIVRAAIIEKKLRSAHRGRWAASLDRLNGLLDALSEEERSAILEEDP